MDFLKRSIKFAATIDCFFQLRSFRHIVKLFKQVFPDQTCWLLSMTIILSTIHIFVFSITNFTCPNHSYVNDFRVWKWKDNEKEWTLCYENISLIFFAETKKVYEKLQIIALKYNRFNCYQIMTFLWPSDGAFTKQ